MAKLGAQDVPLTGLPPSENAYVLTELPRSYWDYYNHRIQVCVCVFVLAAGCVARAVPVCACVVRTHRACLCTHACACACGWPGCLSMWREAEQVLGKQVLGSRDGFAEVSCDSSCSVYPCFFVSLVNTAQPSTIATPPPCTTTLHTPVWQRVQVPHR